jgi:hypothetical protein
VRSKPTVTVTCDFCGQKSHVELTAWAPRQGWDKAVIDDELTSQGWTVQDLDACPRCTRFGRKHP